MGQKRDIVVVGAGLGGMTAIAQWAGAWPKRYARDGEETESGRIYLGPPDAHTVVAAPGVIRFEASAMFDASCPSADRLFASAAAFYGERVIAVLLTGATRDGLRGIEVRLQDGRICGMLCCFSFAANESLTERDLRRRAGGRPQRKRLVNSRTTPITVDAPSGLIG